MADPSTTPARPPNQVPGRAPGGSRPAGQAPKSKTVPAAAVGEGDDAPVPRGLNSVIVRNEFYRDGYRTLLKIAIIQALIIVGLILAMYYVIQVNQPKDRYFATTSDGRLVPMVALNEPNLSTPALMSWAAQSATEVMTFGYHDYRRRLQEASRNFTRIGWASFTTALETSRIMEMVEANQYVVNAAPTSAPVLLEEGVVQGRYQWRIEVPIVVTYQAGAQKRADSYILTLLIVRVSKLESPNGVGIEQWVAQGT